MKRSILFLAFFVCIVITAFAQVDLNKRIVVGTSLVNGHTLYEDEEDVGVEASVRRLEFNISIGGKTEDGTFGFGGEIQKGFNANILGFAWWQPVPEITVALGEVTNWQVPLGRASGDITGWRFLGEDSYHLEDDAFWEGGGYAGSILRNRHGFYQGADYSSVSSQAQLSGAIAIRPLTWFGIDSPDKLNIIFFFPTLAGDSTGQLKDTVKSVYLDRIEAQISYDISGIGQAAFSYRNSMREQGMEISVPNTGLVYNKNYSAVPWYDESKALYAQWSMNLPLKMGLEVGLQYTIAPDRVLEAYDINNDLLTSTAKWPVNAGLGWIMGDREDPFILSTRMGFQIPVEDFHNFMWGRDVAANIRLGDRTRLYVPVGLGLIFPSNGPSGQNVIAGKDDDMVVYWTFSPYVVHDLHGPKIHLCFRIHNGQGVGWPQVGPNAPHNGEMKDQAKFITRGEVITWSIPVYLSWSF
jgi:hypothetical protein